MPHYTPAFHPKALNDNCPKKAGLLAPVLAPSHLASGVIVVVVAQHFNSGKYPKNLLPLQLRG